jgi:hypothetical protein
VTNPGKRSFLWLGSQALPLAAFLTSSGSLLGQEMRWESIGARFGFNPSGGAAGDFYQAETCAHWVLPWNWHLDSLWRLQTGLDAAGGLLGEHSIEAAIFSAGPTLNVIREKLPLSLEFGISPTVLTRTHFSSKDLGFPFQFTSHAGLNLDVSAHVRLTYRFQHMSNAAIAHPNPGLNLHLLGVSYLF